MVHGGVRNASFDGSKHSGTAKTNPSLFQGIAFIQRRDVAAKRGNMEISHRLKVPFHLSLLRFRLETNGLFEFTSPSRMQAHVDHNIRRRIPSPHKEKFLRIQLLKLFFPRTQHNNGNENKNNGAAIEKEAPSPD
jgi:hypothetical protein